MKLLLPRRSVQLRTLISRLLSLRQALRSTLQLQPTKLTKEIAEHEEDISVWTGDVRTATMAD